MLFAYTYVPHQMEKMQEFIDFIFFEVWCKAPIGLPFHVDLFQGNPDLQEVMSEFGFSAQAPVRGKAFYKDVTSIYDLFAGLTGQEIDQFKQWYQGNNDIEKACANDPSVQLVRYVDIPPGHEALSDQLASFFNELYSQSLLNLAALKDKIGDINDHYKSFVKINNAGKCPFCGVNDLLGEHHSRREAYDHYLPKSLYPFNSINFRNLVPTCHHCNSSYKAVKDPAFAPKQAKGAGAARRKAFYPYRTTPHAVHMTVQLGHADFKNLQRSDINFTFGPAASSDELATWCDVYGIDERYRAKLLGENDGRYWLEQAMGECENNYQTATAVVAEVIRQAKIRPFAECNFLKSAFLQACHQVGILI